MKLLNVGKIAAGAVLIVASATATAVPISVTQSQDITESGQTFVFDFLNLDTSDGTGGQFRFYARGDYTSPRNETAFVSLDLLGGSVRLADTGELSNSISGLDLAVNNTIAGPGGNDQILDFIFDISADLMNSLLSDSQITVKVENERRVTFRNDPKHRVEVGFDYNSAVSVSEPSTLALLALGLVGVGFAGRRKAT